MDETFEIGPVPSEEDCEQLGPNYDRTRAMLECRTFIAQLKRQFGEPPEGARFTITSNPHDFGTYHEVAIRLNPEDEAARTFAFLVEENAPATWDDTARAELGLEREAA